MPSAGSVALVLLGSIVLLTNELPYPGTAALWPVLATAAVIAAGAAGGRPVGVGAALSWLPMRALGRLSYSWYLWHWPFLVLAASMWGDLSVLAKSGLALLALVPSVLAFRFVERPLHHLPSLVSSTGRSLRLGAALSVGAALAGVALALGSGGGALASGLVVPTGADEQTGRGPAALAPSESPSPPAASPSVEAHRGRRRLAPGSPDADAREGARRHPGDLLQRLPPPRGAHHLGDLRLR